MSLDKLYQQILLTEQQLAEQTHKLKEGMFFYVYISCFDTLTTAQANQGCY